MNRNAAHAFYQRIWRILSENRIRLIGVLGLLVLVWACYPVTRTTYSIPQDSVS